MATFAVEVVNLRKSFDRAEVLRGVSFRLDKGETLVVMGGSGSGKTVLLRHAAGLLRPDAGELILELKRGPCDTSIVVTHDVELARTVADRLAILMDGRFATVGRPDEVMTSGEPAVQAFLAGEAR